MLMKDTPYYTIEKLPNRKNYSLNRYEPSTNTLTPVSYFTRDTYARLVLKELQELEYKSSTLERRDVELSELTKQRD